MRETTEQSRESLLHDFVAWSAAHITGDEKGQAQIFLDRLFRAFGQKGSLDVGGTAETRIRKASEDGGGTSFADYVWKPVVLIEMKKRGADLSKHYRQAFDYWVRLVPDRLSSSRCATSRSSGSTTSTTNGVGKGQHDPTGGIEVFQGLSRIQGSPWSVYEHCRPQQPRQDVNPAGYSLRPRASSDLIWKSPEGRLR
jgi:hypothetical protein